MRIAHFAAPLVVLAIAGCSEQGKSAADPSQSASDAIAPHPANAASEAASESDATRTSPVALPGPADKDPNGANDEQLSWRIVSIDWN